MFTGLVECTTKILDIKPRQNGTAELLAERPSFFDDLEHGHSVAHNGVCLTITNKKPLESEVMSFDLGEETLKMTTLKTLKKDSVVNLERPLKIGERLHGHLVTGHVDEVCEVDEIKAIEDGCANIRIHKLKSPELIWKKGSVVINGVSLTINEAGKDWLEVCLIPETLNKTNLSFLKKGDLINIEYDFLAKSAIHADKFRQR